MSEPEDKARSTRDYSTSGQTATLKKCGTGSSLNKVVHSQLLQGFNEADRLLEKEVLYDSRLSLKADEGGRHTHTHTHTHKTKKNKEKQR